MLCTRVRGVIAHLGNAAHGLARPGGIKSQKVCSENSSDDDVVGCYACFGFSDSDSNNSKPGLPSPRGSYDESSINTKDTMGCSQSVAQSPTRSNISQTTDKQNGVVTAGNPHNQHRIVEKAISTESSSSDEDPTVRALEVKGCATASDADLIKSQRSEKCNDNAGLEDRWIRSHFSDIKNSNNAQAKRDIHQNDDSTINSENKTIADFPEKGSILDIRLKPSQEQSIVSTSSRTHSICSLPADVTKRFSILHFNDVYELTERKKEPVGGAARFSNLFQQIFEVAKKDCNGEKPFIAFGGDCLNPSILSSATKGRHMIEVLNHIKVNAAVFGNHEFDFGVEHAADCAKSMNFPWFLSNVTEKDNGEPFGDGVISRIMPWNGLKIGLIGLIEEEWLDTLTTVDKSELCFEDYVTRGNELASDLKTKGANLVIALTHMRWPNDIRLAQEVKNIDIILGGHDHEYGVKLVDDCVIVKSGCEFQTFSRVDLFLKNGGDFDVSVTRYDVTSKIEPAVDMENIVNRYMTVLERQLQESIGPLRTSLDGLYKHVRSRETNLGNFVADVMRMTTRADIVLINSGTFRSNTVHSDEEFRVRDLMSILPIHDNVVILEVTGQQLLRGLENAVCKYPRHEGRFAQVSGFCFGFDPKASPGKRVVRESVKIHGEPLDLERFYKLATKAYVARGRDGYECFRSCRLFNDPDSGPIVSTVVRNHISNVAQLLKHQERTGEKLRVTECGKKIISASGHLHEVYSASFEDSPVHKLQKSMEDILPKDLDINGNRKRRDSELSRKRDFVNDVSDALYDRRAMHMQHLLEINRDGIFDESKKITDSSEMQRRTAIEENKNNFKLLKERQKSYEDVRWQIWPLVEGRIFHCSKK
ncbi:snake venom 5'-nucleotidase-like isoform X1 [Styela clava]